MASTGIAQGQPGILFRYPINISLSVQPNTTCNWQISFHPGCQIFYFILYFRPAVSNQSCEAQHDYKCDFANCVGTSLKVVCCKPNNNLQYKCKCSVHLQKFQTKDLALSKDSTFNVWSKSSIKNVHGFKPGKQTYTVANLKLEFENMLQKHCIRCAAVVNCHDCSTLWWWWCLQRFEVSFEPVKALHESKTLLDFKLSKTGFELFKAFSSQFLKYDMRFMVHGTGYTLCQIFSHRI